jgi:hypothetical protein
MPVLRLLIAATILSGGVASAVGPLGGGGEFIVNSQVVSDEVTGGGTSFVGDVSSGSELGDTMAGCNGRTYGYPDLFYNYYTQGNCNRTNAQMLVAPVPVPPNVGHTFMTYQPFQPEEMLYWHTNRYHNYYDNGRGMNHTRVHYYAPPVRTAASNFYWNVLRIPR